MKKGLLTGFTPYQKNIAYNIFKREFKKYNIQLDLFEIDNYALYIKNDRVDFDISNYDFCVMLAKDQYISALFERAEKPCFNSYKSIFCADDKFLTHLILANNKISMPKTISGNTYFRYLQENYKRNADFKNKVANELNFPLVAKPTFSFGGQGIQMIKNIEELDSFLTKIENDAYIFQEFVEDNSGADIRCVVVGDEVIFSLLRKNDNSFLSNISAGGTASLFKASKELKETAVKCAKLLGLVYCSVDFFYTNNNQPLVCEVNANPGGVERNESITGISQAKKFVFYIVNHLCGRKRHYALGEMV